MDAFDILTIAKRQGHTPETLDNLAQQWETEASKRSDADSRDSAMLQAQRCKDAAAILRENA